MFAGALPLLAVLVFSGLGFGWRSWLQLRRYGSSGIVIFRSGRPGQHLREALFLVLAVALFAEAALAAVAPRRLPDLVPLAPAAAATLRVAGTVLVLGATALMLVAQLDLGASWRVGIEEGARPGLVTGGLYRYSRNPIYVAMLTALLGFTLLLIEQTAPASRLSRMIAESELGRPLEHMAGTVAETGRELGIAPGARRT